MRSDKTTGQFTRAAKPAAGPSPAKLRAALDAVLDTADAARDTAIGDLPDRVEVTASVTVGIYRAV